MASPARVVRRILDVVLGTLGLIAVLVAGFIGVMLIGRWVGDQVLNNPPRAATTITATTSTTGPG